MRYLPLTNDDRCHMLDRIGAGSVGELFCDVPAAARLGEPLALPDHAGELEVERHIGTLADANLTTARAPSFLGAGAYRHHIPAAVSHLISRSEFLTSYTPYQPEISQGTLQYLFEFQTQVARITGMEVANASMYDGSTACAEAVLMARRVTKRKKAVLSGGLHPQYGEVTRTMTRFTDNHIVTLAPAVAGVDDLAAEIDGETSCVVVQNPSFFGHLADLTGLAEAAHGAGALLIVVVTECLSLGALRGPGEMGADIVVCEGQSLGNALSFGGPYLGLFATRRRYMRQMPGRLCGRTRDGSGRPGYVLTLSTREQHIRREKATSNICTNSGLCALAFCIHLSLLGEAGFTGLAVLNHDISARLADQLDAIEGVKVINQSFFNEFTLRLNRPAAAVAERLAGDGILAGVPLSRLYPERAEMADLLLVAATETVTQADMDRLVTGLEEALA